jgi:NADH-quinone oxidoreductase subunit H
MELLAGTLVFGTKIAVVLGIVLLIVAYLTYFERKVAGHIQWRYGPMRVGPHGLLQPIADGIKLLIKEDVTPAQADRIVFVLAPIVVLATAMVSLVPIPWSAGLAIADLNIGILYVLAVGSLGVYGIILGGWASNSKYSFLGGLRSAAQMVSYEVPLALAVIPAVMQAGTLHLGRIVEAQDGVLWGFWPAWFGFWVQPVGFLALFFYFISAVAETNRLPFDLPEAESELVAGFHTEYSGMKFAFFFLGEYLNMIIVCALAALLFLGGWLAPPLWLWVLFSLPFLYYSFKGQYFRWVTVGIFVVGLAGYVVALPLFWFGFKVGFLLFFMMWIRWTYPRFRYDQLMNLGWLRLIPLTLANILLCGLLIFE